MTFVVVDSRRPPALGIGGCLQLEAFCENVRLLLTRHAALARRGCIDSVSGLVTPSVSKDDVLDLWLHQEAADVARIVPVPVPSSAFAIAAATAAIAQRISGDGVNTAESEGSADAPAPVGLGWDFLSEAIRAFARVAPEPTAAAGPPSVLILATDFLLPTVAARRDHGGATAFFSAAAAALRSLGSPVPPAVTLVIASAPSGGGGVCGGFVSGADGGGGGSCGGGVLSAADTLAAWEEVQDLASDASADGGTHFDIEVVDNTPAQFEGLLRRLRRLAAPKVLSQLHLPITSAFRGSVQVALAPCVADTEGDPSAGVHGGLSELHIAQAVPLQSLDLSLCHGVPLACRPAPGARHEAPNRLLLQALCRELTARDLGLLVVATNPLTRLSERWLLVAEEAASGGQGRQRPRALLLRLATAETALGGDSEDDDDDEEETDATDAAESRVCYDGCCGMSGGGNTSGGGAVTATRAAGTAAASGASVTMASAGGAEDLDMERAAVAASLDAMPLGMYDPMAHHSGFFELEPLPPRAPALSEYGSAAGARGSWGQPASARQGMSTRGPVGQHPAMPSPLPQQKQGRQGRGWQPPCHAKFRTAPPPPPPQQQQQSRYSRQPAAAIAAAAAPLHQAVPSPLPQQQRHQPAAGPLYGPRMGATAAATAAAAAAPAPTRVVQLTYSAPQHAGSGKGRKGGSRGGSRDDDRFYL